MKARVYMVGSFKGGVGKTVTTWNLAYSLAAMGQKVLAVDYDCQANLTTCFGAATQEQATIAELMMSQIEDEEPMDPLTCIVHRNGVDYIPSSMALSAVDSRLRLEMGVEGTLREILNSLRDSYDVILIDTCPSLGSLTINALAAADEVLIAVNPQLLAMMGLQDFLKTVGKIRRRINKDLQVAGILLTMCDARTTLCKVISNEVAETFQGNIRIFESVIPATVRVGESVYYSEPLLEYAPENKACEAYMNLARELMSDEE